MKRIACSEFHQRAATAAAGAGVRAIEPGMPLPAGTGLTRRGFLSGSLGLALTVYGAGRLGLFEEGIANAAALGGGGRILVTVFLPGGADGMSMLYPEGDPHYRKLRPKLALSGGTAFTEDTRLAWHPALSPLAQLHAEGKVTVMPAIGYDHPDQSHFTSRHYWEVGATDPDLRSGWLGRYLDEIGSADNPLQGLSLTEQLEPALATTKVPVAAIAGPDQYSFGTSGVWGPVQERMFETIGRFGGIRTADPALRAVGQVAEQSDRLRLQLRPFSDASKLVSPVDYPQSSDGFPKHLSGLAAMIGAGLPIKVVALEAGGEYDTHAGEADALQTAFDTVARSLLAFQHDLEARKVADRVLTLVWTEFGRRAEENGSGGTDHGAAGAAFLIGTRASGKMVGEFPGLGSSGLDKDGNVRATTDFRGVYVSLLEQWLGFDAARIIPQAGTFARPTLLR